MSQIADVKCVMLELAYLEALDVLYSMQCNSTDDLEKLVLWSYRNDNACTDAAEDCCILDILSKYSYAAEDCTDTASCSGAIILEPSYCGDITLAML